VVCVHIFCFSFSEKNMFKEKAVSPRSPPSIYIHMCTLYTYEYMYAEISSIWILRALCVCVCVYTHVFFLGIRHCATVLQTQVPTLCTDLNLGLLYILIYGIYSKFTRENNFLALGVCFPQPCSSAGRRFAESRPRLQNYRRIVSFPQQFFDEMRCKLDSTENPRSFEKYPTPP